MDCPAEEELIRLKLEHLKEVRYLDFNIPERKLVVFHSGNVSNIHEAIHVLDLDDRIESTVASDLPEIVDEGQQTTILWLVLAINLGFFIIELVYGLRSNSMGLVADSLDMLADSLVYGLSLAVVSAAISQKKRIAKLSGYFQMALAAIGIFEVGRRFLGYTEVPDFQTMVVVSLMALIANVISLKLLQTVKSQEAHIKASSIFTSNDIVINLGVIAAGVLVFTTGSKYPDLIIGLVVFIIVLRGALRILKLS
jgi:Co/Zn/Cd efflux system component